MNSLQSPGWFQPAPRTPRVLHSLSLHNSCHFYPWGAGTAGDLLCYIFKNIKLHWSDLLIAVTEKSINSDALCGVCDSTGIFREEQIHRQSCLRQRNHWLLRNRRFSTLDSRVFLYWQENDSLGKFVSVFSYISPWENSNDFGEPMAGIDLIIRTHLNAFHGHGHLFRQEHS